MDDRDWFIIIAVMLALILRRIVIYAVEKEITTMNTCLRMKTRALADLGLNDEHNPPRVSADVLERWLIAHLNL